MWSSFLISANPDDINTTMKKVILGVPLFGRSYQLSTPKKYEVGSLSSGKGKPGPYSKIDGYLTYLEVCQKTAMENFTIAFDETQSATYAYNDKEWISYDDKTTVQLKAHLAIERNLGGLAVYPITNDACSSETFPITRAIKQVLSDI
jgi:chitinase